MTQLDTQASFDVADTISRLAQTPAVVAALCGGWPSPLWDVNEGSPTWSVTLEQLLETWVTHDFAHVVQMARIATKHYGRWIGPWRAYFSLLQAPAQPGAR